jgi:hypothetical protein
MVTPAEAAGALGALKAAADLSKSLIDAIGAGKLREQAYGLHGEILGAYQSAIAAREAEAALKERVRDLETEIARLKTWDGGAGRYKLQQLGNTALAYVYQGDSDGAEPPHWLCATCFDKRQKGYLVGTGRALGNHGASLNVWQCQTCKASIQVHYNRSPGKEAGEQTAPARPSIRVILD